MPILKWKVKNQDRSGDRWRCLSSNGVLPFRRISVTIAGLGICKCNVNNKFIEREGTKVSNALECRLQHWANRKVFNWRRKLSIESSGSRRYSGKLFQVVGSATANEQGPWTTLQVEYNWLLCDDRSRYLDDIWFTGMHSSERYSRAVPWIG